MTPMNRIDVGNPTQVYDHILIPIERTSIFFDTSERRCWCHASKQLIALIVRTPTGIQAFEMETGRGPVTICELEEIMPEIAADLKLNDHT